jgi:hypothetical protein
VENALRSIAVKCGPGGSDTQLVNLLLPLTAFYRLHCEAASTSLGDGYALVDNLLDVLCTLWWCALSTDDATADLWEQLKRFRLSCVEELELYADWSWMDKHDRGEFEAVPKAQICVLVEGAITSHLAKEFPWQSEDLLQLLQRQSEYVIDATMLDALRADGPRKEDEGANEKDEHKQTKTPSAVIQSLRSLR